MSIKKIRRNMMRQHVQAKMEVLADFTKLTASAQSKAVKHAARVALHQEEE